MTERWKSLAHLRWECKYRVVFIPEYRRKALYGEIRTSVSGSFHELARQKGRIVRAISWRTVCIYVLRSCPRRGDLDPTAVKVIVRNHSLFVCDTLPRGGSRRSDSLELAYGAQALCASWVAP
jgi:REP element-mobilizing transposase RayT